MSIKKTLYALTHLFIFGVFIFIGITIFTPGHVARAALSKRVFLTSGTSWTVPADWSDVNTIETIGGGGHGGSSNTGGGGGGGGAYASITNLDLTAGASVTYRVIATSDTVFNTSATTCAGSPTPSVCAKGGTNASGSTNGTGGLAASSVGTVKYSGSDGASWGGNAAGLHGDGQSASFGGGLADAGYGGSNGDGGFDFCPDLPAEGGAGGTGYPGYEYSTISGYGSGGGGGVGGSAGGDGFSGGTGGNGGSYGGGAGGGGARCGISSFAGSGGNGAGGLIIITYTSTETGSTSLAKFKIKGGSFLMRGGSIQIR